jgi:hypothetical protein
MLSPPINVFFPEKYKDSDADLEDKRALTIEEETELDTLMRAGFSDWKNTHYRRSEVRGLV